MDTNVDSHVSPKKYFCKTCTYYTNNKKDWTKHIVTLKHIKLITPNATIPKVILSEFKCKCEKIYKHNSSLYFHRKTCKTIKEINNPIEVKPEITDKELIMLLIQQNAELLKSVNNTNITNNNSHNKTFNLQFFLKEECKDALNINEFVSSIEVELEDLEATGRLGYVEGISRIINKNLKILDQNKRPIHCSDIKREVLYIKDNNQWIKEEGAKPIFKKAIREIANENIKQIGEWRKKYPDCTASDSRKNDTYLNIVSNAMSGCTSEEQLKNYEKIITNVAKGVSIDK